MDDLISRKALLTELRALDPPGFEDSIAGKVAIKKIKEAPAVSLNPQWIPVTERLPEPEKRVLILTRVKGWNGKMYQEIMCGFYEDGNIWCEDSNACWDYEMKREENYDEIRDDYTVPEGWFEELLNHIDDYNCVAIGEPVTHWMPLPTPPKEE